MTKISNLTDANTVTVPIDQPGAYLFRAPHRLRLSIYREVVVALFIPSEKACGLIYFHPSANPKDFFGELELLRLKLETELRIQPKQIVAKAFGLATGPSQLITELTQWAKEHEIKILAKETGRNVRRAILIDCDSTKVGVSYIDRADGNVLQFISQGTARSRNPLNHVQTEVLILSENTVKRTLGKQAIEEQPNWSASTPLDPQAFLKNKNPKEFPWSVVLLFEDMGSSKELTDWILQVKKHFGTVQFRWVGTTLPPFTKQVPDLRLLPPLEPELIPNFKELLKRAVFEHFTSTTSDVLNFPKKKRAR